MRKKIIYFLVPFSLIAIFLCFSRCKKDSNAIPNVVVDQYIYLSQPEYVKLNAVGGWVYVSGGVKGIIVYARSTSEFAAYERDCPYDPNVTNARVDVDSSGIVGVDLTCGSKFVLSDGSYLNGPTTHSLKSYFADYDASGRTVHVHN